MRLRGSLAAILGLAAILSPLRTWAEAQHYAVSFIRENDISDARLVEGYAKVEQRPDGRLSGQICAYSPRITIDGVLQN